MDGVFDESWQCVTPTFGRYTIIYFDFVPDPESPTGAYLYVTNDWVIDLEGNATIPDDCFNLFTTQTGGGRENWVIKVYGDQTVWVSKNGAVVQRREDPVNASTAGATGFGMSPNANFSHTIFELRFPASRGPVIMRLGDPVRTVVTSRKVSFASEAARMHRSSSGAGGCPLPLVDEPNVFTIVADDPPTTTTKCVSPPCGFFWPPALQPPWDVPEPRPCDYPRSFVLDGVFDESWKCVLSARGRYTRAYFDWVPDESSPSGGWLYILNDWMVNDKGKVPPHCFNRFSITTGGGSETWNIRVYGDQTVWVRKNGVVVQNRTSSSKEIADGAVGFGMSPNAKFNHTIFELRFPASEGIYSTRLGDPVRYVSSLTAGTTCIMADEPNVFTYRSMQSGQQMAQGGRQMWSQGGSQGGWQQVGGQQQVGIGQHGQTAQSWQGSQQQTSQSGMSAQSSSSQSSQSSAQQRTGQSGMSGMSMSSQQVGGQQQVGSTQHSSQGTPVESSQNT